MKNRFGFIERQDGNDVLVHVRAINGLGFTTLPEGHEVEFGVEQGRQGPQATDVTILKFC